MPRVPMPKATGGKKITPPTDATPAKTMGTPDEGALKRGGKLSVPKEPEYGELQGTPGNNTSTSKPQKGRTVPGASRKSDEKVQGTPKQ